MKKLNSRLLFLRQPILLRLRAIFWDPEIETVLHPTPSRLKWLGIFTLLGHPLFWYIWSTLSPQAYESLGLRIGLAVLGLGFLYTNKNYGVLSKCSLRYFTAFCWIQLPVFFTWMYWQNNGNAVWLATLVTIVLLYLHLTDWRIATLGLITGVSGTTGLAYWQLDGTLSLPIANAVVIIFAFLVGLALAASSANARQERLRQSLVLIGIMAHELRTPLATASLIGQAIVAETTNHDEKSRTQGLNKLAKRLEALTLTINHHIDLQMMNARFMQLPHTKQLVSATGLVNKVVTQYPFSSKKEENCIEVVVHQDFMFFGSERQFIQVLNNLLKNALYSLKAAQSRFTVGDLRIELGVNAGLGRFSVADKGMGIGQEHLARVFEPFFSTNQDTGHGLGLAYCKQVVQKSGGVIGVRSEFAKGTFFTIDLPVQPLTTRGSSHHALSSLPSP